MAADSSIAFSKMHGLGNDFVVIDGIHQAFTLPPARIKLLADRHMGIGFDQLLIVASPDHPEADFRYRIFNADGSEAEQCGNGARCFVHFVRAHGLTDKDTLVLETRSGLITARVEDGNLVSVDMAIPDFEPAAVPFAAGDRAPSHALDVDGRKVEVRVVSMGNPHAVILVDDVTAAPVAELGPLIAAHERFPQGVNVGFMEILDRVQVRLRVFERGSGETLACGSGACAAVAAGRAGGLLDERVLVELPGGRLLIQWPGEGHPVRMTGPATPVFEGRIQL